MKTIKELDEIWEKTGDFTDVESVTYKTLKDVWGLFDEWCEEWGIHGKMKEELKARITG